MDAANFLAGVCIVVVLVCFVVGVLDAAQRRK